MKHVMPLVLTIMAISYASLGDVMFEDCLAVLGPGHPALLLLPARAAPRPPLPAPALHSVPLPTITSLHIGSRGV